MSEAKLAAPPRRENKLNVRLPEDDLKVLDELAEQWGTTPAGVARMLIRQGLRRGTVVVCKD